MQRDTIKPYKKEKEISYFLKLYILLIIGYILFLFYYIYSELVKTHQSQQNLTAKEEELTILNKKLSQLEKIKKQMSTPQYKDRMNKEIKGKLQEGEHQFKTPQIHKKTKKEIQIQEAQLYLQKPIIEEWKDVFFHQK